MQHQIYKSQRNFDQSTVQQQQRPLQQQQRPLQQHLKRQLQTTRSNTSKRVKTMAAMHLFTVALALSTLCCVTVNSQPPNVWNLNKRLLAVESRLDTQIFFSSSMSTSPVNVTQSPFKFDQVLINVGNGYSSTTGVFTAPKAGVYVFYTHIMLDESVSEEAITYVIDKSGTELCLNEMNGIGSVLQRSASCFATTHLNVSEQVAVKGSKGNTVIKGGKWCWFTGFLLSTDAP